jgi:hypothetical protein
MALGCIHPSVQGLEGILPVCVDGDWRHSSRCCRWSLEMADDSPTERGGGVFVVGGELLGLESVGASKVLVVQKVFR